MSGPTYRAYVIVCMTTLKMYFGMGSKFRIQRI